MLLLNRQSVSAVLALPLLARYGYLKESGWLKSRHAGVPVDNQGHPLPWFTYPSIDFLKDRVSKDMDVFEYGAGNSTLWWADRVGQVVTCEHDENWYKRMFDLVPDNVALHHLSVNGGEYASMILRHQSEFDIVVIDGKDRVTCAKNCLPSLKEGGVIVWDNSDRDGYAEGYEFLLQNGYHRRDFEGMGPINRKPWNTSIFYRMDNCLGIKPPL